MNNVTAINPQASGRGVLAVLGPTNTGKTHLAIDRMISHQTGLIGLPLRLLAREVYERVAARVGVANVALVTGEERINADGRARFQVCTVEAMPEETDAEFVAIDEVQLAADLERGHIFTKRLLKLRGRRETMLLGAATVHRLLQDLLPGISIITRPRMSMLTWAGQKKLTRLPSRSAIVAFSADEVYAIAELIRRQRGGAAVVLGSLSPRTRNAQVELYQSGDVDFLVATDAIGMGLNLDLDHVAFAQERKFDGYSHRRLTPAEMGQIAGRAGRHIRNGTFGVSGQVKPFEDELVERLETHQFDAVKVLIWRNSDLEFSTLQDLRDSLETPSASRLLMKSPPTPDLTALERLSRDEAVVSAASDLRNVRLLWDACQIPDYRRISPGEHAELLRSVFLDVSRTGRIDEDWFARQVEITNRVEGDIDALSARIAHVRTWTYLSHRADWMRDPVHWQERTREIEDRLSDALHESLTKRFVDRRTSVLMKRLRENAMLEAEISASGAVTVEGHHIGQLNGFRFQPDSSASGPDAKATAGAAQKALATEIARRAERLGAAANGDIALASDGTVRWLGDPVAKAVSGDDLLRPRIILLADEQLTGPSRDIVQTRLDRWLGHHIATLLKPLVEMSGDQTLPPLARGLAYRLVENLGILDRRQVHGEVQQLDQDMRAALRRHGVRFGAYHVFIPALLKPAPTSLICLLWGLKNNDPDAPGLAEVPALSAAGRTSFQVDPAIPAEIYGLCGFRVLGDKAVRVDILERLADLIRPALSWRQGSAQPAPDGAVDGRCFIVTPAMLSILGATHGDMEKVLKGLGYRGDVKPEAEVHAKLPVKQAIAEPASVNVEALAAAEPSVEADAAGNAVSPEDTAEVLSDEESGKEASVETPVEIPVDAPAEEVRTITLWRPGRTGARSEQGHRRERSDSKGSDQRPDGHPRQGKGKGRNDRKFQKNSGKPGGGGHQAPRRPAVVEKPVDPDSPFAKLAALKAAMKRND
ncbi:MAG: helicase-related protein [Rhizobiaceae bacterium]